MYSTWLFLCWYILHFCALFSRPHSNPFRSTSISFFPFLFLQILSNTLLASSGYHIVTVYFALVALFDPLDELGLEIRIFNKWIGSSSLFWGELVAGPYLVSFCVSPTFVCLRLYGSYFAHSTAFQGLHKWENTTCQQKNFPYSTCLKGLERDGCSFRLFERLHDFHLFVQTNPNPYLYSNLNQFRPNPNLNLITIHKLPLNLVPHRCSTGLLVHLTTCGWNSEPAEQWAVRTMSRPLSQIHYNLSSILTQLKHKCKPRSEQHSLGFVYWKSLMSAPNLFPW